MKMRFITTLAAVLLLSATSAQAYTIKLVFEQGFSDLFGVNQEWENVNETTVKNTIVSRVTADFSSYGVSVSTSTGDVTVYIGRTGSGFGSAITGIGSYTGANPYAEVYAVNFSTDSAWMNSKATAARIAEGIAGTISHEAGHLFNLYHAFQYDTYDPTLDGALFATLPSPYTGTLFLPAEPPWFVDYPGMCGQCSDDTNNSWHLMSTGNQGLTSEEKATYNRYFGANSIQILNFAEDHGVAVTRNSVWGIENTSWNLQNDVSISAGKTLIISNGSYTHNMNGHKMTGTIESHGTFNPNYAVRDGVIKGQYNTTTDAFAGAAAGDTIMVATDNTGVSGVNYSFASATIRIPGGLCGKGSGVALLGVGFGVVAGRRGLAGFCPPEGGQTSRADGPCVLSI